MKNAVPSFISSETMRPLRLATTPYTLPRTSPTTATLSALPFRVDLRHSSRLTCSLNVARIHRELQPRRPVEQAVSERILACRDQLSADAGPPRSHCTPRLGQRLDS